MNSVSIIIIEHNLSMYTLLFKQIICFVNSGIYNRSTFVPLFSHLIKLTTQNYTQGHVFVPSSFIRFTIVIENIKLIVTGIRDKFRRHNELNWKMKNEPPRLRKIDISVCSCRLIQCSCIIFFHYLEKKRLGHALWKGWVS